MPAAHSLVQQHLRTRFLAIDSGLGPLTALRDERIFHGNFEGCAAERDARGIEPKGERLYNLVNVGAGAWRKLTPSNYWSDFEIPGECALRSPNRFSCHLDLRCVPNERIFQI